MRSATNETTSPVVPPGPARIAIVRMARPMTEASQPSRYRPGAARPSREKTEAPGGCWGAGAGEGSSSSASSGSRSAAGPVSAASGPVSAGWCQIARLATLVARGTGLAQRSGSGSVVERAEVVPPARVVPGREGRVGGRGGLGGARERSVARSRPRSGVRSAGRPRDGPAVTCLGLEARADQRRDPVGAGSARVASQSVVPGAGVPRPRALVSAGRSERCHGSDRGHCLQRRRRPQGRQRLRGRQDTVEVAAAPRAQRPVEAHQAAAVGADAVQPRPTGGADDPLVVDTSGAGRTALDRLDLGQQRLLGEGALVHLADLLLRSDDPVGDHGEREKKIGVKMMTRLAAKYGRIGFADRSCMSRKAQ